MHILVIDGSPKGANSITLQTVNYLQILYPNHTFEILHAGARIKALEKDFTPAADALKRADLLLFSYPVYTFIAPYQLHRFIELLKAGGVSLSGKFAAQLSTSKHFYDVTAHRYIEDNCKDLGLKYIGGLSADMDDLTCEKGQREAREFFDYICWCMEQDHFEPFPEKAPAPKHVPVTPLFSDANKTGDIVIVTSCAPDDTQLQSMIERFRAVCAKSTRIINIREYPFKGGCLGCFNCAVDGKCVYNDGFDRFLREDIQTAESIVYAFTIQDHSMGAAFKLYDD
ncbi:MAG: NAD(P)H-dependent oxidoreductase, partial [Clostridia bacterium]|nr:NAD(P)H-dependent oxidoreductase [Clostridia bacterium]